LIQAFQASNRLSSSKPGKSAQATVVQRLLGRLVLGPGTTVPVVGARGGKAVDGALATGTGGALPQAASIPTIRAAHHHAKTIAMTLLLLEALGAGLLFIGIIWWTMFSGRPDGDPPSVSEQDKDKPSS
jgi:hypothetical protein